MVAGCVKKLSMLYKNGAMLCLPHCKYRVNSFGIRWHHPAFYLHAFIALQTVGEIISFAQ